MSSAVLSSWKEIAAFMGKGVRTVQRWERVKGLPVHRLYPENRGIVLAFPEELNIWMRGGGTASDPNETKRLRIQLNKLLKEKNSLTWELESARAEIRALRSCLAHPAQHENSFTRGDISEGALSKSESFRAAHKVSPNQSHQ